MLWRLVLFLAAVVICSPSIIDTQAHLLKEEKLFEFVFTEPFSMWNHKDALINFRTDYLNHKPPFPKEQVKKRLLQMIAKINQCTIVDLSYIKDVFEMYKSLEEGEVYSELIKEVLFEALKETCGRGSEFGLTGHGIGDLLRCMETATWKDMSNERLLEFLKSTFSKLTTFECFSGFASHYLRHLTVIFDLLGKNSIVNRDSILDAFSTKTSLSAASSSHLLLYDLLMGRLGANDQFVETVSRLPIKSSTGLSLKTGLLHKLKSELPAEDLSMTFNNYNPPDFKDFVFTSLASFVGSAKISEQLCEYLQLQLHLYCAGMVDLSNYMVDIQRILQYGVVFDPSEAERILMRFTHEMHICKAFHEELIIGIMFNLDETLQLKFLVYFAEMFISTTQLEYLKLINKVLPIAKICSKRLAEFCIFLFYSLIELIDGEEELKLAKNIFGVLVVYLAAPQYNRIVWRLIRNPIVLRRNVPNFKPLLLASLLEQRSVSGESEKKIKSVIQEHPSQHLLLADLKKVYGITE